MSCLKIRGARKKRASLCATVCLVSLFGGCAADHETVGASSAFRRLTAARRAAGHECRAWRGHESMANLMSKHEKASRFLSKPCFDDVSRVRAEIRCTALWALRLCARHLLFQTWHSCQRSFEVSAQAFSCFDGRVDGFRVAPSVRVRVGTVARARTGEGAEAMPGGNGVFSPGDAFAPSAAQRAVSRRWRFVFARQRHKFVDDCRAEG